MPTSRLATLGVALLVGAFTPAHAQSALPAFSIEGNVLYNTFPGRAFRDVGDGAGFEALGTVGVGAFALGAGYVRTTHNLVTASEDAVLSGPFVETRLALPFYYRSFTPYLSGRVARLTQKVTVGDGSRTATGTQLGGGLGMLVRLAPGVRLNMGATYANLRLRDAEQDGARVPDSGADGGNLGLRAGISIGAGGWGVH